MLGVISDFYIDDIVVYSQNHSDHSQHLRQVFEIQRLCHLTLKSEKCSLLQPRVNYLGYVTNIENISCQNSFIFSQCPFPNDVKSFQNILGLINYFRLLVLLFITIACTLIQLFHANIPFIWSNECETAFVKLKSILDQVATLANPDYSKNLYNLLKIVISGKADL